MSRLDGKVVLIMSGDRGTGYAAVRGYVAEGSTWSSLAVRQRLWNQELGRQGSKRWRARLMLRKDPISPVSSLRCGNNTSRSMFSL
jgi:NAD(P)-dependent dehydrogenase (short-subunit alcohol dehydrogenase family)